MITMNVDNASTLLFRCSIFESSNSRIISWTRFPLLRYYQDENSWKLKNMGEMKNAHVSLHKPPFTNKICFLTIIYIITM